MIKCWKKIKKFRGDSRFYSWANRISRNLFYDLERKKKREPTVSLDSILEESGKDFLDVSELSHHKSLIRKYKEPLENFRQFIGKFLSFPQNRNLPIRKFLKK